MAGLSVKNRAKKLFEMQDVAVKTRSVEEMLAPLIKQVSCISTQWHMRGVQPG